MNHQGIWAVAISGLLLTAGMLVAVVFNMMISDSTVVSDIGHNEDTQEEYEEYGAKCLEENEEATFRTIRRRNEQLPDIVIVRVRDTNTGDVVHGFEQTIIQAGHYHPVDIQKCHVYFSRSHNYDFEHQTSLSGYSSEIWQYDYSGVGKRVVTMSTNDIGGAANTKHFYNNDFRVSPNEHYIALTTASLDMNGYALVVKDLETMEDMITIFNTALLEKNKRVVGRFHFLWWTDDGRYFWSQLYEAANTNGWIRVDTTDWSYEVFEAPDGIMNGYPLNLETGWIPLIPDSFWTGVSEVNETIHEERREAGETADLYLYNLFTEELRLIDDTDSPTWNPPEFYMQWVNDSTLEYMHPSGEVKRYTL